MQHLFAVIRRGRSSRRRRVAAIAIPVVGAMTKGAYSLAQDKPTASKLTMAMHRAALLAAFVSLSSPILPAHAQSQDPDLIFRKSTTFKLLTPNDKLAVYGIDDPIVEGIACHYTAPEKGGVAGALGLAVETSDISLSCRQYGPIRFNEKFARAMSCSARNGRFSSRRCRSCGAATPSGIYWCI